VVLSSMLLDWRCHFSTHLCSTIPT
jgi:hypothetical protein